MKLKHRHLEQIRKSPESVNQVVIQELGGGKSMVRYWDWAVGQYHHTRDVESANNYLLKGLSNFNDNKKNNEWREVLVNKFNNYIVSYENLKFQNLEVNNRLNIDIEHNNFITGEIFRVDKSQDNGFVVTLQNRKDEIWAHELRFRVLQVHYSNVYRCPYDLVKVGVFNFESGEHEYVSFDDFELKQAWDEVTNLSNKINQIRL